MCLFFLISNCACKKLVKGKLNTFIKPLNFSYSFYHSCSLFHEQILKEAQNRLCKPGSIAHYILWAGLKGMSKLNKMMVIPKSVGKY